jgi:hypothetical protein
MCYHRRMQRYPFGRDFESEASRHFQGTPASRLLLALALGRRALALHRAAFASPLSREAAVESLRRSNRFGRRPSQTLDVP